MKTVQLLAILLCMFFAASAQRPTEREEEEEDEKMEQQAKRMMDSLQKANPAIKNLMKQTEDMTDEQLDSLEKNLSAGGKSDALLFPKRNTALLNKVKDTLNSIQLAAYINDLYKQLQNALAPDEKRNIANINPSIFNNATALAQLSVLSWYNGGSEEAAVLAAKAVSLQPNKTAEANNLCAILVMGGLPDKAIPILNYVVKRRPNDASVNNNLAQAYAALGASDLAQQYISKCLKLAPKHPEANCTAAYIEAAKGNRTAAISYAERSLEGGYNDGAYSLLMKLNPPKKKWSEFLAKGDLPGNFNAYKFELPRHQLLIGEGPKVEAEYHAFQEALEKASSKIQALAEQYENKGQEIMEARTRALQKDPMTYVKNKDRYVRPLSVLGMRMLQRFSTLEYSDSLDANMKRKIEALKTALAKKQASIEAEYKQRAKGLDCGEGQKGCPELEKLAKEKCKKIDAAVTEYLQGKAVARTDWQTKKKNEALKVFFLSARWGYLGAPEKNMAMAAYYRAADDYLTKLKSIAINDGTEFSYCNPHEQVRRDSMRLPFEVRTPECPFELEIPLIVGKLGLNCEEASFGISAGASFKFTQNFASKQSTLSVGIGLSADKSISVEGIEASAGASAGQSVFITFDKNNTIADAGMNFGVSLSAGYGVKANIKIDNAGEKLAEDGVGMGKSLGEKKLSMGYSLTMNAGFTFDEGPLKDMLSPKPEQQINPKVKVYKQ